MDLLVGGGVNAEKRARRFAKKRVSWSSSCLASDTCVCVWVCGPRSDGEKVWFFSFGVSFTRSRAWFLAHFPWREGKLYFQFCRPDMSDRCLDSSLRENCRANARLRRKTQRRHGTISVPFVSVSNFSTGGIVRSSGPNDGKPLHSQLSALYSLRVFSERTVETADRSCLVWKQKNFVLNALLSVLVQKKRSEKSYFISGGQEFEILEVVFWSHPDSYSGGGLSSGWVGIARRARGEGRSLKSFLRVRTPFHARTLPKEEEKSNPGGGLLFEPKQLRLKGSALSDSTSSVFSGWFQWRCPSKTPLHPTPVGCKPFCSFLLFSILRSLPVDRMAARTTSFRSPFVFRVFWFEWCKL